ncbi:hypothetical protein ACQFYA_20765 [Promicromonospora sp. Marseille-Q5078]
MMRTARATIALLTTLGAAIGLTACSEDSPEPESATTATAETPAEGDVPVEGDGEYDGEPPGGGDEAVDTDDPYYVPEPPWEPGEFEAYAPSGGVITMQIPAEEPPEDLENLRKEMGGDPVAYISADIDNRDGESYVNMYELNLYDPAGKKYTFTAVSEAISEWSDNLGESNEDVELYNEGIELSEKYPEGVDPSERATMILTGEKVPDQIANITLYAEGGIGGETGAYPVAP